MKLPPRAIHASAALTATEPIINTGASAGRKDALPIAELFQFQQFVRRREKLLKQVKPATENLHRAEARG